MVARAAARAMTTCLRAAVTQETHTLLAHPRCNRPPSTRRLHLHSSTGYVQITWTKKVNVAHTRLPSVGFRSWSRFLAVSLHVTWVINPAVGCHYFRQACCIPDINHGLFRRQLKEHPFREAWTVTSVMRRHRKTLKTLLTYDAAGALACARQRIDVTRCKDIVRSLYGPLCANMPSSIKPEVRNVSQRRATARGNMHKRFHKVWTCSFGDMLACVILILIIIWLLLYSILLLTSY